MTPKKDIIRKPTYTLPDGSPIPTMGKEFNKKENAFIYWYCNRKSEAFMNAGRAAVRAGYKPENAVIYGYQLTRKSKISKIIDEILGYNKDRLRELIYRIVFMSIDRMFFDIRDFYRQVKIPVKDPYKVKLPDGKWEKRTWRYAIEAIPLNEISERNRMCIDNIDYKGPKSTLVYKLPDRSKAADTFFQCAAIIFGKKNKTEYLNDLLSGRLSTSNDSGNDYGTMKIIVDGRSSLHNKEKINWKKTAEFLRGDDIKPVIAPSNGKAPKNAIEAL